MARGGMRQTLMRIAAVTVRIQAYEMRVQMARKVRLQDVHDKKQGMPLYLREGSERQTLRLDSCTVLSYQHCHVVMPRCARTMDRPSPHRMRRTMDRWPPG
jgi:hypothetical protein